ncbi:MAG: hypothetical protein PHC29_02185 [Candidatus Omnitrophica bacterium]|nr:hypothetical protein [Candidatus Omnitrophota bacterium]
MKIIQEMLMLEKEAPVAPGIQAMIMLSGLFHLGVQDADQRRSAGMRVIRRSGITAAKNAAIILSL